MVGELYHNRTLDSCPAFFEPDTDPKARGIRAKDDRYREIVAKTLNMTADAIKWDFSEIIPDMPETTVEQWTQTSGWGALIRKNGEYAFVSGICAGFRGEWSPYFMPVGIIVSNPYNRAFDGEYTFGENAVLLRNDTAMQGLFPIICPRAELMVETDVSIYVGLNNLRIINIIRAATDNMKTAAESFFRQIGWGRLGVIPAKDSRKSWSGAPDNPVIENIPTGGVPANYMIQFVETAQYIRGCLYNELGLQYNSNMKRESLNSAETSMNDDVLHPIIDNMMECRKRFVKDVKTVFGIDLKPPELAGAWKRREQAAEQAVEQVSESEEQGEQKEGAENEQN